MQRLKKAAEYAVRAMQRYGAENAQCIVSSHIEKESNSLGLHAYLLREIETFEVEMTAVIGRQKASFLISSLEENKLENAACYVVEMARLAGEGKEDVILRSDFPKDSNERPRVQIEEMYRRFEELLSYITTNHPDICTDGGVHFQHQQKIYLNTNGEENSFHNEKCQLGIQYVIRKNGQSSSTKFAWISNIEDLAQPFIEQGNLLSELEKTEHSLNVQNIPDGQFQGTLLVEPEFASYYVFQGLSKAEERLKEGHTVSISPALSTFHIYTDAEYTKESDDQVTPETIIRYQVKDGTYVDESWRLEGESKKTHEEETIAMRNAYKHDILAVGRGKKNYDELLRGIKRGLLLGYVSGPEPDANGDFSGVAKNSFYIEDGEIKYAVKETMVRANMVDMLGSIEAISHDRKFLNGQLLMPWVAFGDVTFN